MSNKTVTILLTLLLLLGVYTIYQRGTGPTEDAPAGESMIASLSDAFVSGHSIKCVYEEEDGKLEINIKDGALRFDNTLESNESGVKHYIHRLDVTHIWDGAKGITFRDISKNTYDEQTDQFLSRDEVLSSLEEYSEYCRIARIGDQTFDQPDGVGFQSIRTDEEAVTLLEGK